MRRRSGSEGRVLGDVCAFDEFWNGCYSEPGGESGMALPAPGVSLQGPMPGRTVKRRRGVAQPGSAPALGAVGPCVPCGLKYSRIIPFRHCMLPDTSRIYPTDPSKTVSVASANDRRRIF